MKLYDCINIGYHAGLHRLGEATSYVQVNIQSLVPHDHIQAEIDDLKKELTLYGYGRQEEDGYTIFDSEVTLDKVLHRINVIDGTNLWFEED